MSKIIVIFFLISTVYASDSKLASSIFNMIAKNVTAKSNPNVYLHTKIFAISDYPDALNIVTECWQADIVILSTIKNIPSQCKNKILFGTRYSHLKDKNIIGAFFWQKGRPNILFYQERLDKKNITLDKSFDRYIDNE